MSSFSRYIKLFSVLFIAVIVAVIVGAYAAKKINPYKQPVMREAKDKEASVDYIASPPSFGPIIQTLPVTVTYESNQDKAFATINSKLLKQIELKQDVILFDKEDYILPLGGVISDIKETNDGELKMEITLPEGTNVQFLSDKMEIITLDLKAQKRLPLSSLQQDENYYYYVWAAYQSDEKSNYFDRVKKLYIDVSVADPDYFVENGEKIESYTPIILNPNKKLDADKKYTIGLTQFEGRHHNPIKQAWLDYEAYQQDQHNLDLQQTIDDCANGIGPLVLTEGGTTLPDGTRTPKSGSCGTSQTDPLQIFNSLINQNSSSGCGVSSCAQ